MIPHVAYLYFFLGIALISFCVFIFYVANKRDLKDTERESFLLPALMGISAGLGGLAMLAVPIYALPLQVAAAMYELISGALATGLLVGGILALRRAFSEELWEANGIIDFFESAKYGLISLGCFTASGLMIYFAFTT